MGVATRRFGSPGNCCGVALGAAGATEGRVARADEGGGTRGTFSRASALAIAGHGMLLRIALFMLARYYALMQMARLPLRRLQAG